MEVNWGCQIANLWNALHCSTFGYLSKLFSLVDDTNNTYLMHGYIYAL